MAMSSFHSGESTKASQFFSLVAIWENFPKVNIRVVDVEEEVEFTGQSMVFTLPVGILKANGKEMHRFVRSFSVYEVLEKIKRFSDN
jgi:hypothetical protein